MYKNSIPLYIIAASLFGGCATNPISSTTSLKQAYKNDFLIGVAINKEQIYGEDQRGVSLIKSQFDSITPENVLKWEAVHPEPGRFDFAAADRYVQFGEKNHMFIIGHTLVWHNQTPRWVFADEAGRPVSREVLLQRLRDHILTVVGRYKGRVKGWDVVNEALNEDGTLRDSPWKRIIGEDYIEKAFQFAHEADPDAQLHYNDYSLENEPKRNGALALIRKLQAKGIPVSAVGLQCHVKMSWPTAEQEDATISAFGKLGVKVMITELDVDIVPATQQNQTAEITFKAAAPEANIYTSGLPAMGQQALARRYGELFRVFLAHRQEIARVTFWGVTDGDSWLNDWPVRGRASYPLLFDRKGEPKPAYYAVIKAVQSP